MVTLPLAIRADSVYGPMGKVTSGHSAGGAGAGGWRSSCGRMKTMDNANVSRSDRWAARIARVALPLGLLLFASDDSPATEDAAAGASKMTDRSAIAVRFGL